MTSTKSIQDLIKQHKGRFSAELGIDLSSGCSREIFKWFLASVLFGARISETIVKKTFREFISREVTTPKAILDLGWDGVVAILDEGGYVRYDFKTATKLLEMCKVLTESYGADLTNLHSTSADPRDLEQKLKSLAKGIGDMTVNIFLREMRGVWEKAVSLPSDLEIMAAKGKGHHSEGCEGQEKGLCTSVGRMEKSGHADKELSGLRGSSCKGRDRNAKENSAYREVNILLDKSRSSSGPV